MTNRQYPTNDFTPIESLDALAEDLQKVQDRGRGRFLAEAKEPAKLKGKKLDALIQKLYSKHGNGVQVKLFNLSKISNAGRAAYETGGEVAADKAIAAAIEQYREN